MAPPSYVLSYVLPYNKIVFYCIPTKKPSSQWLNGPNKIDLTSIESFRNGITKVFGLIREQLTVEMLNIVVAEHVPFDYINLTCRKALELTPNVRVINNAEARLMHAMGEYGREQIDLHGSFNIPKHVIVTSVFEDDIGVDVFYLRHDGMRYRLVESYICHPKPFVKFRELHDNVAPDMVIIQHLSRSEKLFGVAFTEISSYYKGNLKVQQMKRNYCDILIDGAKFKGMAMIGDPKFEKLDIVNFSNEWLVCDSSDVQNCNIIVKFGQGLPITIPLLAKKRQAQRGAINIEYGREIVGNGYLGPGFKTSGNCFLATDVGAAYDYFHIDINGFMKFTKNVPVDYPVAPARVPTRTTPPEYHAIRHPGVNRPLVPYETRSLSGLSSTTNSTSMESTLLKAMPTRVNGHESLGSNQSLSDLLSGLRVARSPVAFNDPLLYGGCGSDGTRTPGSSASAERSTPDNHAVPSTWNSKLVFSFGLDCLTVFHKTSDGYKESVLPGNTTTIPIALAFRLSGSFIVGEAALKAPMRYIGAITVQHLSEVENIAYLAAFIDNVILQSVGPRVFDRSTDTLDIQLSGNEITPIVTNNISTALQRCGIMSHIYSASA